MDQLGVISGFVRAIDVVQHYRTLADGVTGCGNRMAASVNPTAAHQNSNAISAELSRLKLFNPQRESQHETTLFYSQRIVFRIDFDNKRDRSNTQANH